MSQFVYQAGGVFFGLWALFVVAVLCGTVVMTYELSDISEIEMNSLLWFVRVGSLLILSFVGLGAALSFIGVPTYYYYRSKTDNFSIFRIRNPVQAAASAAPTVQ